MRSKSHSAKRQSSLINALQNSNVDHLKKNDAGGVFVQKADIVACFQFFGTKNDTNRKQESVITASSIKERLEQLFGPDSAILSNREIRQLMEKRKYLEKKDFEKLLLENKLNNFDHSKILFECLGQKNGFISSTKLRHIFRSLGHGELTDEELKAVLRAGDINSDGRINLQDFRDMVATASTVSTTTH